MKTEFEQVAKDEFDAYIKAYPRALDWNVSGMFEPPLGSYNDFTLGNWPESMIAKVKIMDGSAYYRHRNSEYYLPKNREKPHDSPIFLPATDADADQR